jgi:valyl-tRNA synthetase
MIADNAVLIQKLARLKEVSYVDQARGLRLPSSGREAWLDVSEETIYEHQHNLEARLAETHANIANLEARLANKSYVEKAPVALVEETKQQLETKQALAKALISELESIQ